MEKTILSWTICVWPILKKI